MNIAYVLTDETCIQTIVSMYSLLVNNKNREIHFYLLQSENFTLENKILFTNLINKYDLNVSFVKCNVSKFLNIKKQVQFNSLFHSFDLCNLIAQERVLFLDSNTIINDSIEELYDTDLKGYSSAAPEYIYNKIYKEFFKTPLENSVNNAILLMDLKKWRKEKILDRIISFDYSKYKSQDKANHLNCFNLSIKDCKILPLQYGYTEANKYWCDNYPITCSKKSKDIYYQLFTHVKKPKIIYYTGLTPLNQKCKNSYASLWWKYAEQTPIYKDIKEFRQLNKYKLSATAAQNSFKYSWLLSRIFPYIKPYWFRILLGFAIAIPLGLLDGVTAFALKPYMDYVVGGKAFAYSWHGLNLSISSLQMAFIIPAGVILFAIIQGVLRYLNGYLSTWTSQRITNDVKFDLFERLIHMHPQFFDDNSSGIVISRYMGDPATASAGIVDQIKTITTSLFGALGLIAVMIYSSWKLAFVGVVVLCIAFLPVALIRKRIKDASNKNMVIGGKITTNINETYSGNKVMAAYGLQDRQNEYFKDQTWKSFNINMSLYKRAGWMSPMMYLIASIGIAIVLGYGTYLINTGHMTAGAFASFVTSLLLLYKPVKTLGNTLTGIQNIFVAMGRVFELFDLEPKIKDSENAVELKGFEKEIQFKDVYFEYVPNQPVLKDINLTIPKNETLAIVGNSGGGKSTLVNLLPRFYDIKSGSITIDGKDIKDFTIKSLRHNISMVFQDNFLYTGTIKENIMMGNPDATTEELMAAIKSAHLEDMIQELPEGLETELSERGLTLSGGQRQRVAIARAMLRNAPIVILDEATSALDNESEAIVQKAMDNLMQNKTVFVIAHRLSTIKNANRIAVINEGNLVELGTHEELMVIENGEYKHLYEMQFRTQEING